MNRIEGRDQCPAIAGIQQEEHGKASLVSGMADKSHSGITGRPREEKKRVSI
jgi:hypothetical protein